MVRIRNVPIVNSALTIYNIYKYRETCHHTALSSLFDVLYKWLPLVLDNY